MKETKLTGFIYTVTILIGSFLLFLVQPIISKIMLPWFGGSSSVWITSMLFFQVALIFGYLYAHTVTSLRKNLQITAHVLLTFLLGLWSWGFFGNDNPFSYVPSTTDVFFENPVLSIMKVLVVTVGPPYFLLATTGPLLQKWYKEKTSDSPYWLYMVSNIGSLAAISIYPFFIEPNFNLETQGNAWLLGFSLYGIGIIFCALTIWFSSNKSATKSKIAINITSKKTLEWVLLAAMPVIALLAVTNELTQEIATIPFLWLLPLLIYLLSFVITFSAKGFYRKDPFTKLFLATAFITSLYTLSFSISIFLDLLILLTTLFSVCMLCHGELYQRRPQKASEITGYYLLISVGGALGGLLVSIIFPLVLNDYYDLAISLVGTLILVMYLNTTENSWFYSWYNKKDNFKIIRLMLMLVLVVPIPYKAYKNYTQQEAIERNFYGVVKVSRPELRDNNVYLRYMTHGITLHGIQYNTEPYSKKAYAYFTEESGGGVALRNHPKRIRNEPLKAGVVGLGVGSLLAYCEEGDNFTVYEINPAVVNLAEKYFTYLESCKNSQVVLGDARLSMEKELSINSGKYDVLVLDAFSDDSIPIHLLTLEAFKTYLELLEPHEGVLAFHISNRQVDLVPVLNNVANELNLNMAVTTSSVNYGPIYDNPFASSAVWVTLTQNEDYLDQEEIVTNIKLDATKRAEAWTDDFSNIFNVLYYTSNLQK